MKYSELSVIGIVRNNVQDWESNIILRLFNRWLSFTGIKYKTDASERSKGTKSKEASEMNEKSKGVLCLFDFLRRTEEERTL